MITKATAQRIIQENQANTDTLKTCAGHIFEPDKSDCCKNRCTRCGGFVFNQQRYWYELGLKHAQSALLSSRKAV